MVLAAGCGRPKSSESHHPSRGLPYIHGSELAHGGEGSERAGPDEEVAVDDAGRTSTISRQ